jgi:hypothetical protein
VGRPPAPPEKFRRNRVTLLFTDAEKAAIDRLAERESLPLTTVAREILVKAAQRRAK